MIEATLNDGQKISFPQEGVGTIQLFKKKIIKTRMKVIELHADDRDLWTIFNRFSFNGNYPCTIPIAHTRCTWKGEMATFIFDNL